MMFQSQFVTLTNCEVVYHDSISNWMHLSGVIHFFASAGQ